MSSTIDIKRIKKANKKTIFSVYGFVHRYQPFCLNPIIDIILCFYHLNDKWDELKMGPKLNLIDENTVKIGPCKNYGAGSALLTNIISDGVFSWRFKIIEVTNELNLGIFRVGSVYDAGGRFFHERNSGYSIYTTYSDTESMLMNPVNEGYSVLKAYGKNCKSGDIVEMILDMDECTLSFKMNDIDCGVAFRDIDSAKYRAAVFFYAYGGNKSGSIEIID